ncbi:MAG: YfhO family protein [Chitinophagaceae bacterium]|nr:YfhO family protein [Chitinophagaceae bacterium]
MYAVGGLFAFLGLMYFSMDYSSISDPELMASIATQTKSDEIARAVISGLKADRNSMFGGQLLRAVGFAVLLLAIFYAYIRSWLKPLTAAIIILVISTLELTITSHDYLNEDNYVAADDYSNINFAQTPVDQQILQDKDPNFRVFNLAGDRYNESRTTYYHKSIGGYHPAKLRIYQDLLEMYLYGNPNQGILNMLNAKYVIIQDPQTGQRNVMPNPNAFGPCWLVKNIKVVDDRVASIKTIGKTNLRDTAIIEKSAAANLVQPQWDSTASIKMINYDNDAIEYEVNGNGPQFAVFSEIYYPVGWNAYIDGKKTEYYNVNYILRGLSVPAGKHAVKFVFEPASVKSGTSIMFISSIIILLVFVGGLFMAWRQSRKKS